MSQIIYKILSEAQWSQSRAAGVFTGSDIDHRDGYIHFSTAAQVRETAARHFAGQSDLVLLGIDVDRLPAQALRWEPSRGGQLFPHLYGLLDTACVVRCDPLPLGAQGHRFPQDVR